MRLFGGIGWCQLQPMQRALAGASFTLVFVPALLASFHIGLAAQLRADPLPTVLVLCSKSPPASIVIVPPSKRATTSRLG